MRRLGDGTRREVASGEPLVREREDRACYPRSRETLLARGPRRRPTLVMVETRNELHGGADVAHSTELGRQYLELAPKYAGPFHSDERLRSHPAAPLVVTCVPALEHHHAYPLAQWLGPIPRTPGPTAQAYQSGDPAGGGAVRME